MRIALISPERTISALGLRYVASFLKNRDHDVKTLFLPREFDDLENPHELNEIKTWVENTNPGLIGMSLMINHLNRSVRIVNTIRDVSNAPILWGGVHPTTDPEGCLHHADIVCIGEGEHAAADLADALDEGKAPHQIQSLWFKHETEIIRNPIRDRVGNLDEFPFPDMEENDQAILHQGKIVPMTYEVYKHYIFAVSRLHFSIATRGCPFNCTYCCNSILRKVAEGPYVRTRSVENLVAELKQVHSQQSWLVGFALWDDSFLSNSEEWIQEFCTQYKKEINLPFFVNFQPSVVTESKVKALVDAGLIGAQMGLQTGSEKTARNIFHRKATPDQFVQATKILDTYKKEIIDRHYHVIVDNPYEDDDDMIASALTLASVEKPFALTVFSLLFYPSTELYDRAVADGKIDPDKNPAFDREYYTHSRSYLALVTRATSHTPSPMIRFFVKGSKHKGIRSLFYLYYYGWYHLRHVKLRRIRAAWVVKNMEKLECGKDPRKVVELRAIIPRAQ